MPTFTRPAPSALFGTPGAPASVAAGGTATSDPLDLGASGNSVEGDLTAVVIVDATNPPTSAPLVQFQYSYDGSVYVDDGGPFSIPTTPGAHARRYPVDPAMRAARAVITGGAGNPVTAYVVGTKLGAS